jgi:hypothetical protein
MNLIPEERRGEAAREGIILGILESVSPARGPIRFEVLKEVKKTLHEEAVQCLFEVDLRSQTDFSEYVVCIATLASAKKRSAG